MMNMWKLRLRNLSLLLAATASIGGSLLLSVAPATAQVILQEQGTLQPIQAEYMFSGDAGQAVVISMTSPDFDTVLVLMDANDQEIARNDDYARTLNSTIVMTLPDSGTYKVLAQSFSGQGGNYTVSVRPATSYDLTYAEAVTQYQQGEFEQAIAAYTQAIQADSNQPAPYAERGEARYAFSGDEAMTEVIADYERAAELYERAGEAGLAQEMRDRIGYLQNPEPEPMPEMEAPDPRPMTP